MGSSFVMSWYVNTFLNHANADSPRVKRLERLLANERHVYYFNQNHKMHDIIVFVSLV